MKKLTSQQIERLYQFTRQHYVEYYDVQTELVDHLASAIEENWQENPEKDFENLLQQEFKKFGVFGFTELQEKRQKTMHWHYLKLLWKESLSYLKLPKIIFILATIQIFYIIISKIRYGADFLLFFSFAVMILYFINSLKKFYRFKKEVKNGNKKLYLLEETLLNTGQFFGLVFIPFQAFCSSGIVSNLNNTSVYLQIGCSISLALVFLMMHVTLNVLPSKKVAILKKAYPEMNLKNV
jgi:hypothetical protein